MILQLPNIIIWEFLESAQSANIVVTNMAEQGDLQVAFK
jgi:hypothetical protein